VTIITAQGSEQTVARASKDEVAARVLQEVDRLLVAKESGDRALRADPDRAARV
jgi:hypothetical protein